MDAEFGEVRTHYRLMHMSSQEPPICLANSREETPPLEEPTICLITDSPQKLQ